ncbi:hypothetical protein HY312_02820 [Candidatus Saccharibacteria bacterium]|nr:hypothetical protein [Candidatus Saccharibacteria bacterium]
MSQWDPEWQVNDLERLIRNYNEKAATGGSESMLEKNLKRIQYRANEIRKRPQSKDANTQREALMKAFRAQHSMA